MARPHPLLFAMTLLASLALPSLSTAGSQTKNFVFDDDFDWAIFSKHEHVQLLNGYRWVQELKKQYGEEFLYVRDLEEKFVITDKGLIERAERSSAKIADYSTDIGEVAGARARLSLAQMRNDEGDLKEQQRRLEDAIEEREQKGKSTRGLRAELFRVKAKRQSLDRSSRITPEERKGLEKRVDKASARLKRGMQKIEDEIREILEDAKERNLAHPVN